MRFWTRDKFDNITFYYKDKNDDEACELCIIETVEGRCRRERYAYRKEEQNQLFVFCHDSDTVSKQAKMTSRIAIKGYLDAFKIVDTIKSDLNDMEAIALHNARRYSTGIGLKVNRIAAEDELAASKDKISFIENKIKANPREAAREYLSIIKSINQIDYEYNVLDSYRKQKFIESDFTRHKAHTLVLMSFYLFEEDFITKKIFFDIEKTFKGHIYADFATARSAIGQILSNSLKYCKPESNLYVKFKPNGTFLSVSFEMTSRYFSNSEKHKFTIKGYRGNNAKDTDGQGVGLYAAQKMMELNGGTLEMNSHENTAFESQGHRYSQNEFTLTFRTR